MLVIRAVPAALFAVTLAAVTTVAAEQEDGSAFGIEKRSDRLVITEADRPVAEYVFDDPVFKRPYLCRVHTPSGIQVTRNLPPVEGHDLVDHPTMHPGIWFGFGDINGTDFWRNKGTIRHRRFAQTTVLSDGVAIEHDCTLDSEAGHTLGHVEFGIRICRRPYGYSIGCAATFRAEAEPLVFGDQEEMGLGVRVATPLAEKNGGRVSSGDDRTGAKTIWGTQSHWCDYSGTIDGKNVGVTIMPQPYQTRPSWWHVRDYGLMVANAFGKRSLTDAGGDAKLIVEPGKPLWLMYHLLVHDTSDYEPKAHAFAAPRKQ